MGSKEIAIFGILLAMVLLISSEVAARELAETSNTINTSKEEVKKNGAAAVIDPKSPSCNGKVYGSCIGHVPKPYTKRRCNNKNICRRPPPTADATTKTDAEVEAEPHN